MCTPLLLMFVAHRPDRQRHLRASTNFAQISWIAPGRPCFNILYMLHHSMKIADIEIRMAIQVTINAIFRRTAPARISIRSTAFLRASLLGAGVLVLRMQSLLLVVNNCNKYRARRTTNKPYLYWIGTVLRVAGSEPLRTRRRFFKFKMTSLSRAFP